MIRPALVMWVINKSQSRPLPLVAARVHRFRRAAGGMVVVPAPAARGLRAADSRRSGQKCSAANAGAGTTIRGRFPRRMTSPGAVVPTCTVRHPGQAISFSMSKPFFITTAIDYTNGAPHIGHAYEKVLADVLARYHRLKGDDVFFLTGVDQHGQKVQQSAEKQGVEPQQFVDEVTGKFRALWDKLDVQYTGWAATTDPLHKECVRANLQKLWDDKDPATGQSRWLYKKSQRGFYSIRQEQFLTDKERGPDGHFGPEWGVVEERDEENFYFRLTQDPATGLPGWDPKQWLLDFIDKRSADGNPFVVPDFRVAELRHAVEKLDGDLCISRPASRLKWGIPFPESFGAGFVTFVWFDALVNYISFVPGHDPHYEHRTPKPETPTPKHGTPDSELGFGSSEFRFRFADCWPPLHVIGKDILIPAHGVYWPVMLKALGFTDDEMPTLLVHGWWNIAGAKMSKSLGNVVDPDALADRYGAEALRYYLVSNIASGYDSDFSEEYLIQRYNTDLANNLGNLLNRTLSMAQKYRLGTLRKSEIDGFKVPMAGGEMPNEWPVHVLQNYPQHLDEFLVHEALADVGQIAVHCNGVIEKKAPWTLAKLEKVEPARIHELDAVLYHLAESLRIIAILISPVLPRAAHGIFDQLRWKLDKAGHESRFRLADAQWGGLPDGHTLGQPTPLFPRIETPVA
jgi:methionyl-tRNA synthetase